MPAKNVPVQFYPSDLDERRFDVLEAAEQFAGLARKDILRELLREKAGSLSGGRTKTQQLDGLATRMDAVESALLSMQADIGTLREMVGQVLQLLSNVSRET